MPLNIIIIPHNIILVRLDNIIMLQTVKRNDHNVKRNDHNDKQNDYNAKRNDYNVKWNENNVYVPETHIMYFIRLKCSEEIHYVPIGDGDM